jgi:hypothetical protein
MQAIHERTRPDMGNGMQRESFGELLGELANNSAALVRDEIELAKQEMTEKVVVLRSSVVTIAVGALIGFIALLALTAAAIAGLALVVGPALSALIIGAVLAVAGGSVAYSGIGRLKRANLKPQQTMQTLEEDKKWLKQLT